jgi:hypothetical protein
MVKHRPHLNVKPFENLLAARRQVTDLAHWANHEHRHSAMPVWTGPFDFLALVHQHFGWPRWVYITWLPPEDAAKR